MNHKCSIKPFWLLLFFCLLSQYSHSLEANHPYYIFHASKMALSAVDGTPNLHTFDGSANQTFQFVKTGNYYYIKNTKNNKHIALKETWNTEYTTATTDNSMFTIEEYSGNFVKIKCASNNLYLGTDGTAAGSNVYSDKNGKETLHYWFLRDASGSEPVTDGLENSISKAEKKLLSTTEGTSEGEFTASARAKLQQSIEDASFILHNSKNQTEIVAATQDLNTAISTYDKQRNPAFQTGVKYYIMHASNRFLAYSGGEALIKNRDFSASQQFTIESNGDGTYSIKNVQSNTYINASGEYNVNFAANNTNNTTHFKIGYAPDEDLYVRFQFSSNNKYLGTDGTSDGKGVFSDKSGTDGKHYWHLTRADKANQQPYNSFHPGSSALRLGMNWYDEDGNHINAHGGCVLYENGTYYWFGENYRPSPVKSNGIVCYTSKDLYNWKREGMAYECPEAALRNDYQDMNYGRTLERPKVMYCPNTGKYVMWVHWENGSGYAASRVAILYSDKITGPYKFIKTMRPRGDNQPSGSRDQTLMFDPDYNAGYHFGSAEENMTMHGTLLVNDYLDLSNTWERIFIKKQYEAPAIFKYHKRFVAITSGCTGWDPNPAHSSYSQMPLSGWNDSGNPCVDKDYNTTYHSQSNYIFKVPDMHDAYIYMGDRWKGGEYFSDANVGESWHIWLPIDMRSGYPVIRFYEEWDLSIFDKINRYRRVKEATIGNTYLLLSKNSNKILSLKSGRIMLGEDDELANLSFKISTTTDGYYTLVTEDEEALTANNNGLALQDYTGGDEQQWRITSSDTYDGYFYLQPKSSPQDAIINLSATTTSDGIVGISPLQKNSSCQFAFCFDSQKHDYPAITDESDGSYQKWIESKGYKKQATDVEEHLSCREKDNDIHLLIYRANGGVTLHAIDGQTIVIYNTAGQKTATINLKADEQKDIPLDKGVYYINGFKWTQY